MYMKIPRGFKIEGHDQSTHVLKLKKNLYGQKQAGRVLWNQHLNAKLLQLGWKRSIIDDCVYYKGNVIFIVYVDDGIFMSPSNENITKEVELFKANFNISVEGDLCDYVGVNIERKKDGTVHMTQPQLINSVLKELNFNEDTKPMPTPALSSTILKKTSR